MPNKDRVRAFTLQAEQAQAGLLREYWEFLRYNRKWWLAPPIMFLLLVSLFVLLSGTAALPFIYALF